MLGWAQARKFREHLQTYVVYQPVSAGIGLRAARDLNFNILQRPYKMFSAKH